jgi:sulfur dioxygenase
MRLPEETLVFPAHDYKGDTVSTIGEEKRFNPRLQVRDADEYAKLMASLNLGSGPIKFLHRVESADS